jgi:hypothetical protein
MMKQGRDKKEYRWDFRRYVCQEIKALSLTSRLPNSLEVNKKEGSKK